MTRNCPVREGLLRVLRTELCFQVVDLLTSDISKWGLVLGRKEYE